MLYYPKLRDRPPEFRINQRSPMYSGLGASYLGQNPGTTFYQDATLDFGRGINGTLTGYTGAGDTPADKWAFDGYLRRSVLGFDGTDDYIPLGTPPALDTSYVTVALWVYNNQLSGLAVTQQYINRKNLSPGTIFLDHNKSDDKVYFAIRLTTNSQYAAGSDGVITAGWHHYAGTYDGLAVKLYVDGVLQSAPNNIAGSMYVSTFTAFEIGRHPDAIGYFNGKLGDIGIWNRALLAAEISALADRGNVDLRVGGVPLILPLRRLWPVAQVAPRPGGRRRTLIGSIT